MLADERLQRVSPPGQRSHVRSQPVTIKLGCALFVSPGLGLRAQRRQRVPAGRRVGEADRRVPRFADARMALVLQLELRAQRGVGVRPAVRHERGVRPGVQRRERTAARVRPQLLRARPVGRGLVLDSVVAVLEEGGIQLLHQRDVQPVQPGHGPVACVMVAVPEHGRGEQEVTGTHGNGVAVNHGPDSLASDDEPERALRVAVRRGDFADPQVLDGRPQGGGRERAARQPGIGQGYGPPLPAPPDRHQLAGALGQRKERRPGPVVRLRRGFGVLRHEVVDLGPQRHQVGAREIVVEPLQIRVVSYVRHGVAFLFPSNGPRWLSRRPSDRTARTRAGDRPRPGSAAAHRG